MSSAISDVLPLAAGAAISPLPIVAAIVVLGTPRARANGLAYAVGGLAGLAGVGAVVLLVSSGGSTSSDDTPGDTGSVIRLVLAAALLALAVRLWRNRPDAEEAELPGWLARIDAMGTPACAVLGLAVAVVNPKVLGLTIVAAHRIGQDGLSTGGQVVALAVYVAVGSLGLLIPLTLFLVLGERARARLEAWKAWLAAHNAEVGAVVLVIIAVVVAAPAIKHLA